MTKKEKVKNFVKKHKAVLLIGTACTVAGGVITGLVVNHKYGSEFDLIRTFKTYGKGAKTGNTFTDDLMLAQIGSNCADVYVNGNGVTMNDMLERFPKLCEGADGAVKLDTEVSGIVVFGKKT